MRSVFALAALLLGGCIGTVTPGEALVQVDVCGSQAEETRYSVLHGGYWWEGPCTDYYEIPTREQESTWDGENRSINFTGVDGQPVNVGLSVAYQVENEDDAIIRMVRKYGADVRNTVDGRVRNSTKDALQTCASQQELKVTDIYGQGKNALFECTETRVRDEYSADGLIINKLKLASEIRLPEQIRDAMVKANVADQQADQARREVEMTKAQAEKDIVVAEASAQARIIDATARAESNRLLSESLTPAVLEHRRLDIEAARIEKWKGDVPTTQLGQGSNVLFSLDN